jgi:hypothetical protein
MENAFKDFLQEGRDQGSLRQDISDEVIISYIRLFQQSLLNNPEIHNRIQRDNKFYQELLSLFIYGIGTKNK